VHKSLLLKDPLFNYMRVRCWLGRVAAGHI